MTSGPLFKLAYYQTESLKEPMGVSKVSSVLPINRAFGRERTTRVRQRRFVTGRLARRLAALVVVCLVAAIFFSDRHAASSTAVAAPTPAQKKRRPKPKSATQTQIRTATVFTEFKHESHREPRAKLSCSNCHTVPAREAPDEIAAATKSAIRGFPYHDSCLECHRRIPPQFFSGAAPAVCNVCHTRSSPRLTARDVYPQFPRQIDFARRQFPGYFPHEKHRPVISDLKTAADLKQVACADCHKRDERSPRPIVVGGDEQTFTPPSGTFETSPDLPNDPFSAHSTCFGCHWETNDETKKPSRNNCRGCHRTPEEFAEQKHPLKDTLLSRVGAVWFKDWPREWPRRVSLKFRHDRKEHSGPCATCHANVVKTATLNIPDVPILSCSKCHRSELPVIADEMAAEDQDSVAGINDDPFSMKGKHKCGGCHTTVIGNAPPPCSHFRLDEDKYLSGDYAGISKRCNE